MRIYEEYLKRHNLVEIPVIHHAKCFSLIFRIDSKDPIWNNQKWLFLSVFWDHHNHHPGHYRFEMDIPIHDGCSASSLFESVRFHTFSNDKTCVVKKWHEYEDYIFNDLSAIKGLCPVRETDAFFVAWEVFVYVYDHWFYNQPHTVKSALYESLNKEKSFKHRYKYYQDVIAYLSNNYPSVLRSWRFDMLLRIQNYADWLGDIIESRHRKSELILPEDFSRQ